MVGRYALLCGERIKRKKGREKERGRACVIMYVYAATN